MFLYIIFAATISACLTANVAMAQTPVICGAIPNKLTFCFGKPKIFNTQIYKSCDTEISECGKMTCIFTESGWLKDGKVEKSKAMTHYSQFARDHPEWSTAVENAKEACLTSTLPAQGVHLNCPAYDIMLCFLSNFAKYALPSQWSNETQCQYSKQFATACPMCPSECFASLVPYGSCNACIGLPPTP